MDHFSKENVEELISKWAENARKVEAAYLLPGNTLSIRIGGFD
jgi:hypothetical protein